MVAISRRDLSLAALATSLSAAVGPWPALGQALVPPSGADRLSHVHPELRPSFQAVLPMWESAPPLSRDSLPALRQTRGPGAAPRADIPHEKRAIAGRRGHPEVPIHVVNAHAEGQRGGILYMHGGGYVLGNANDDIPRLQGVAEALDCCIISVDYRLAPETPYQGSIEDNYAGLLWLHRHAASLGVDPAKLAVMGSSAGGGHAALLAIAARDRGEVALVFQSLTYPMLDDRTGSIRKPPSPIGELVWTSTSNIFGWRCFLGMEPGGDNVPNAAVPARQTDLSGLPPAWIGVGAIDLFISEDLDYGRRLIEAGVATEMLVVPGAPHGFDVVAGQTAVAKHFHASRLQALRRAFSG